MGHSSSKQRLSTIKDNVSKIADKIQADELTEDDRNRSHEILVDYIKELRLILNKSGRKSTICKVEKLIIAALEDLATLEGNLKNVEPRLKAKSLQTLHDIERDIRNISDTLTNPNYETEKEVVSKYKKRISLIENFDQEVDVRKNELLDAVNNVENVFSEMEYEEKLKRAEEKHYKSKVDLKRFVGVSDSGSYKKQKEHLMQLKDEVNRVVEVSERIEARKKYLLFNIDNNIAALESKVKENEDKIRRQASDDDDVGSIEKVVDSYNQFETSFPNNCSSSKLEEISRKLTDLKMRIEQKLEVLNNQIQIQDIDPYVDTVPVKDDGSFDKIKQIQMDLYNLQHQITKSTYTKSSHLYTNFKKNLEDAQTDLEGLKTAQNATSVDGVLGQIDQALILLESNALDRMSSSGDVLIDLMSLSANVNQLGRKIQSAEDYNPIETELLDYWYYLRKLTIPVTRRNVCQLRDYVVIEIESHLSNLEKLKMSKSGQEVRQGLLCSDL